MAGVCRLRRFRRSCRSSSHVWVLTWPGALLKYCIALKENKFEHVDACGPIDLVPVLGELLIQNIIAIVVARLRFYHCDITLPFWVNAW